ncbi:MAG TPA: arsenate reductase ArsC [Moraxellaceae bacterium]
MTRPWNVLFLCTGNSARSILAEVALNLLGHGRFRAYSAGSRPLGQVNPYALEIAVTLGYPLTSLSSKSWEHFSGNAPAMDIIITVCDKAAGETCPVWPGHPATAHWGFADPATVRGSDGEKRKAFLDTFHQVRGKVQQLVDLPLEMLDAAARQSALHRIGRQ